MRYCKRCVMPDTRPGIIFDDKGVCFPCRHYEERKNVDWDERWKELERLADKYRGSNGDYYDCIIAASAGKDSYYQTYILGVPDYCEINLVIALGYPAEQSLVEEMKDESVKYWRDEKGIMHVPKRDLSKILHRNFYKKA